MLGRAGSGSSAEQARDPIGDGITAAHLGLNQTINHETRRHMDAVLASVLGMPLHLAVEIRYRKGVRELHATVALDPGDDVVGCRVEVRPAAMALELELLTVRRHRHDEFCRHLAAVKD